MGITSTTYGYQALRIWDVDRRRLFRTLPAEFGNPDFVLSRTGALIAIEMRTGADVSGVVVLMSRICASSGHSKATSTPSPFLGRTTACCSLVL
jgi:hypothetical protein